MKRIRFSIGHAQLTPTERRESKRTKDAFYSTCDVVIVQSNNYFCVHVQTVSEDEGIV
jgi:hypothetical protein